jgi:hypothetical protein
MRYAQDLTRVACGEARQIKNQIKNLESKTKSRNQKNHSALIAPVGWSPRPESNR